MIGSVATYHQADSRRRDFHELDRLPGGLVAVGDAVASFNPIYGQGMTSAALHASCISSYLRSGHSPHEPAHAYFDQVRVIVDAAWQTSTLTDLALPHVDGPYPRGYKVINRVSNKVLQTSMNDPVISHRLGRVATMLAHPSTLARPSTLLRVAWKGAREAATRRAESAQIHVPEARRPAASTGEPSI
jgi:2-polyprenyl-6-methoxyphenol hydroxylase-like FAD-dependent oxidoreductase